jgi:nitrous oxidase accessory protein
VGRPYIAKQVGAILLVLLFHGCLEGKTWIAEATGRATIQCIVDSASPGDTVRIMPGHYRQGNIVIRKSINFIGINFPVLDGEEKFEIMTISANNVSVIGIEFINTGVASINDIAAISAVECRGLRIQDNRFENTFFGIHLANSASSLVSGNTLHSDKASEHQIGNGIHAWKCDSLIIRDNNVSGHRDGIYFEFVTNSIVDGNNSHDNMRYGLHFMFSHKDHYRNNIFRQNGAGVAVMYTQGVTMTGNKFEDNWGASSYGLLLKDIRDSFIDENKFTSNTTAIYMEGSSRCSFKSNTFAGNGWAVKIQANCDDNIFAKNNFVSNTFDMATNGSLVLNSLDNNYWDSYSGYDLDRDGIGDVAHHPVSLYSMVVEKMPSSIMLWRSVLVYLLDKTEKVVPSITPEALKDNRPSMRRL